MKQIPSKTIIISGKNISQLIQVNQMMSFIMESL